MRALFLILLLFAIGAASAYYLRADNGYVLVSYGHWMLETSVVGLVAALVLFVALLLLLLRAFGAGLRLPSSVRDGLSRRRVTRQHRALTRGLQLWLAGRDERAELTLQKDIPEDADAACHHLIAVIAADRQQQSARAARYLERAAEIEHPLVGEAVALMQASRASGDAELATARAALERLRERSPSHPRLYPALAEVMLAEGDWQAAFDLLRGAEKARGWAPGQWQRCMSRAVEGALGACLRIEEARQIWAQTPSTMQKDPACEGFYADALLRLNAEKELMSVVHRVLEQRWAPDMVGRFLRADLPDNVAALASVEQWLQHHGEKPQLLLAAAYTCRRNRLWGKARSYLDVLIEQAPSPEAYYEYGQLCGATQQPEEARRYFEAGLKQALAD